MKPDKKCKASSSVYPPGSILHKDGFEIFFRENFLRFCLYCQYKFGFEKDQAREIVHTSFIRLWETRESITADASLSSYFSAIVFNNSIDALRHRKVKLRHKHAVLKNAGPDPAVNEFIGMDLRQLRQDIHEALATLPLQMRTVFELSRFGLLTYAEIAARLGISLKTVETQMGRALQKLRKKLSCYLAACLLMIASGWQQIFS